MKKILITLLVAFVSCYANAQNQIGTCSITPKVGLNVAQMTNADGADARIGVVVGAEFDDLIQEGMVGLSEAIKSYKDKETPK